MRMNNRRVALALGTLVFLGCVFWSARMPGDPPALKDVLFLMGVFGVPFLVFGYTSLSLSNTRVSAPGVNTGSSLRSRIAFVGAVLAATSAGLLLLLLPFWSSFVERERLAMFWVIAGALLAIASTICGLVGSSKLRRAAVTGVVLLPFWLFAAALLLKAVLD